MTFDHHKNNKVLVLSIEKSGSTVLTVLIFKKDIRSEVGIYQFTRFFKLRTFLND